MKELHMSQIVIRSCGNRIAGELKPGFRRFPNPKRRTQKHEAVILLLLDDLREPHQTRQGGGLPGQLRSTIVKSDHIHSVKNLIIEVNDLYILTWKVSTFNNIASCEVALEHSGLASKLKSRYLGFCLDFQHDL